MQPYDEATQASAQEKVPPRPLKNTKQSGKETLNKQLEDRPYGVDTSRVQAGPIRFGKDPTSDGHPRTKHQLGRSNHIGGKKGMPHVET